MELEQLIYRKSWTDVSINDYFDLVERLDQELTPYEAEIVRVAFVSNLTEDQVWSLDITTFNILQQHAKFLDTFKLNESFNLSTIVLDEKIYSIDTNLQHFTVGQYIDFQTYYSKRHTDKKVLGNILACFIIPKGKKYGEDYDIAELVKTINNYLDIKTANEILFFFLKNYLISIRGIANYFNWQMKRIKMSKKDKETLTQQWNQMKQAILDGLHLLTASAKLPETSGMTSLIRTYTSSLTS